MPKRSFRQALRIFGRSTTYTEPSEDHPAAGPAATRAHFSQLGGSSTAPAVLPPVDNDPRDPAGLPRVETKRFFNSFWGWSQFVESNGRIYGAPYFARGVLAPWPTRNERTRTRDAGGGGGGGAGGERGGVCNGYQRGFRGFAIRPHFGMAFEMHLELPPFTGRELTYNA